MKVRHIDFRLPSCFRWFIWGAVVSLQFAAAPLFAEPAIEIVDPHFDFGHAAQHATVCHRFVIRSTGSDTLVIKEVVPGCGCTQAPLKDSVLAPGESTHLDLFFSTKSYRGKLEKRPHLVTNAGPNPSYLQFESVLIAEGEQDFPLSLNPSRLDVSQFTADERRVASAWVVNHDRREHRIQVVDHADEVFEVKAPELVPAGDSAKIKVQVLPDWLDREFEYSVTIQIDDSAKTRYTLPVRRMLRIKDR